MNLITTLSPTNISYPYEGIYDSRNVYKPSIMELKNLCPSCFGQTVSYYKEISIGRVLRRRCVSGKTTGCSF